MKGGKKYLEAQLVSDKLYQKKIQLDVDSKKRLYLDYLTLLKESAYKGYPEAQFELALHYEEINFFGINPNFNSEKCKYWHNKACKSGVAEACNNLAIIYENEKKMDLAEEFYRKAIKLGSVNAKNNFKK